MPDADLRQIEQFVYREARYADEHDCDAREALRTDDALYRAHAGLPDLKGLIRRGSKVRFPDALELETVIWLPEGHLVQLLDPSADRWRDA